MKKIVLIYALLLSILRKYMPAEQINDDLYIKSQLHKKRMLNGKETSIFDLLKNNQIKSKALIETSSAKYYVLHTDKGRLNINAKIYQYLNEIPEIKRQGGTIMNYENGIVFQNVNDEIDKLIINVRYLKSGLKLLRKEHFDFSKGNLIINNYKSGNKEIISYLSKICKLYKSDLLKYKNRYFLPAGEYLFEINIKDDKGFNSEFIDNNWLENPRTFHELILKYKNLFTLAVLKSIEVEKIEKKEKGGNIIPATSLFPADFLKNTISGEKYNAEQKKLSYYRLKDNLFTYTIYNQKNISEQTDIVSLNELEKIINENKFFLNKPDIQKFEKGGNVQYEFNEKKKINNKIYAILNLILFRLKVKDDIISNIDNVIDLFKSYYKNKSLLKINNSEDVEILLSLIFKTKKDRELISELIISKPESAISKLAQIILYHISLREDDKNLSLYLFSLKHFINSHVTEASLSSDALYIDVNIYKKEYSKIHNQEKELHPLTAQIENGRDIFIGNFDNKEDAIKIAKNDKSITGKAEYYWNTELIFKTEDRKMLPKWKDLSKDDKDKVLTWKKMFLSVNDKWNRNSIWKLIENTPLSIDKENFQFIDDIYNQMFGMKWENGEVKHIKAFLTDKQAYYLALYGVYTKQLD